MRTIPRLFRQAVEEVPDKPWLLGEDGTERSYRQSLELVERAATWFRAAGIHRQDRVMVTSQSTPAYLLCWLALMELGAVQVAVNPSSSEEEITGFIGQVEPRLVVTHDALMPLIANCVSSHDSVATFVGVDELFRAEPDGHGPADLQPDEVAVMIPTSGTTGRSKLVMQTHLAYVMAGEGFPYWLGLTSDDRLMTSLPLFHINAPAYSTLGSMAARGSLALLAGFSASRFIDQARRFEATEFNAIGAMLEILMRQPPRPDDADNPLRLCYTGPSPDRERQLEIENRFGFEIVCGYALSESPYGLIWPRGSRPYGTLGAARQHPELGHVNNARVVVEGRRADRGEVGLLELQNPAIMRGYYEMPEETKEVLVDGWLRTGDLVTDNGDGTYTFVGRAKQVIRRRGENLSPAEVEAVLERHPDVAEAAVVAVPSELSEDDIKAFVIAAPQSDLNVADLRRFASERLARFKVPRYFEVVEDLPHTPTGRLAKHQLSLERNSQEVDMEQPESLPRTWIGSATADRITVADRDLAAELMGRLTLTQLAYLLIVHREPSPSEQRMLDAVLVSLADHGLTPSALAARLTLTGAPEATQGAIAAGLLGAGSVLLGPAGDTAQWLAAALGANSRAQHDDESLRQIAEAAVDARRLAGERIPGLGHPVHRLRDPRTARIYELASEERLLGPHLRLLRVVAEVHEEASGLRLPINGAGAGGAALVDAGLPPNSVRGFVLIARTAGLVAHLVEEQQHPLGMRLWLDVEHRAGGG